MNEAMEDEAPARTGLQKVLYGEDGLRAIWALLLFAAFAAALAFGLAWTMKHLLHLPRVAGSAGKEMSLFLTATGEWSIFGVVAMAAFLVSRIEKRPFAAYGIGPLNAHRLRQFLTGCGWGAATLTVLVLTLHFTGHLAFGGVLLHGAAIAKWGALWAVAFLGVGMMEEFLTRGFLQFTLARGFASLARVVGIDEQRRGAVGFWVTAVLFSLLFGLGHKANAGESPVGLFSAGFIGLVFAFSLWRTGSLWWAIGWHAAWDWAQSFLWSVPDSGGMVEHHLMVSQPQGSLLMSGGLTGPEGSLLVLPVILATALLIHWTLPPEPGSASLR